MISLNDQQKKAVDITDKHVLVLAGVGSGKTRVITAKMIHLIKNKNINPQEILAITFTNKSANEMQKRILAATKDHFKTAYSYGRDRVNNFFQIKTFHAYGAFLLRIFIHHHPRYAHIETHKSFTIVDNNDQKNILKIVIQALDLDELEKKQLLKIISSCKNNFLYPDFHDEELSKYINTIASDKLEFLYDVQEIYQQYQEYLYQNYLVDFDDLIALPVLLLRQPVESMRAFINRHCRYVLVDEYQDTNIVQENLIELFVELGSIITAVGDDFQSIYSFRGAYVKNILNFEKKYPDVVIIKMEENYRSTGAILNVANDVIRHNTTSYEKNLFTKQPVGELPEFHSFTYENEEANWVTDKIQELMDEGIAANEIAIFFRTNYQSKSFEDSLLSKQMPYQIVGGLKFYARKEIKDLIAYINFLLNGRDFFSLERIINFPTRGIGEKSKSIVFEHLRNHMLENENGEFNIDKWLKALQDESLLTKLNAKAREGILFFHKLTEKFYPATETMSISQLVTELLTDSQLVDYYENLSDAFEGDQKLSNLRTFVDTARMYEEDYPTHRLGDFIHSLSLQTDLAEDLDKKMPWEKVQLMTIHNAKGLEFEAVFITGMAEGLCPHYLCMDDDEALEEERRLFYVGITRAKKKLFFSFSTTTSKLKMQAGELKQYHHISSFLNEITVGNIDLKNLSCEALREAALYADDDIFEADGEGEEHHDYF